MPADLAGARRMLVHAEARRQLGELTPREAVEAAGEALAQGVETPGVVELAGENFSAWRDAAAAWERALAEVGLAPLSAAQAVHCHVLPQAQRLAAALLAGADGLATVQALEALNMAYRHPQFLRDACVLCDQWEYSLECGDTVRLAGARAELETLARALLAARPFDPDAPGPGSGYETTT